MTARSTLWKESENQNQMNGDESEKLQIFWDGFICSCKQQERLWCSRQHRGIQMPCWWRNFTPIWTGTNCFLFPHGVALLLAVKRNTFPWRSRWFSLRAQKWKLKPASLAFLFRSVRPSRRFCFKHLVVPETWSSLKMNYFKISIFALGWEFQLLCVYFYISRNRNEDHGRQKKKFVVFMIFSQIYCSFDKNSQHLSSSYHKCKNIKTIKKVLFIEDIRPKNC